MKEGKKSLLWKNRNLRSLVLGQTISTFGDYVVTIGLSIFVYQRTGSALGVALVYLVTVLPSLLSVCIGPLLARIPLKRIMISSDLLRALLIGCIPFVADIHMGLIYLLMFIATMLSVSFKSSRMTLLTDLVEEEELARANSLDQSMQVLGIMGGMALGGFLTTIGYKWVFWIDSLTFIGSALILMGIHGGAQLVKGHQTESGWLSELVSGFRHISQNSVLIFNVFVFLAVFFGAGVYNSMMVVYAYSRLDLGSWGYTIMVMSQMIGIISAGFGISKLLQRFSKGKLLAGTLLMLGLMVVAIGMTVQPILVVLFCLLAGASNLVSNAVSRTMLMESSDREQRGNVMNTRVALSSATSTMGATVAGLLIDWAHLSTPVVMAIGGACIIIPALIGYLMVEVNRYGHLVQAEESIA